MHGAAGCWSSLQRSFMSKFLLSLLTVALSSAAVAGIGGKLGNGIGTVEIGRDGKLDASGSFVEATTSIPIIDRAADKHSPHCAGTSIYVGDDKFKVWLLGGEDSNCKRICIEAPAGYEIDTSRGISGTTSHAWSALFNPEAFFDRQDPSMCILRKTGRPIRRPRSRSRLPSARRVRAASSQPASRRRRPLSYALGSGMKARLAKPSGVGLATVGEPSSSWDKPLSGRLFFI